MKKRVKLKQRNGGQGLRPSTKNVKRKHTVYNKHGVPVYPGCVRDKMSNPIVFTNPKRKPNIVF